MKHTIDLLILAITLGVFVGCQQAPKSSEGAMAPSDEMARDTVEAEKFARGIQGHEQSRAAVTSSLERLRVVVTWGARAFHRIGCLLPSQAVTFKLTATGSGSLYAARTGLFERDDRAGRNSENELYAESRIYAHLDRGFFSTDLVEGAQIDISYDVTEPDCLFPNVSNKTRHYSGNMAVPMTDAAAVVKNLGNDLKIQINTAKY